MSIEITEELIALVEEHRHYRTEATARHLAAYTARSWIKRRKNDN